jgi:hypothetical protein
MIGGSFVNALFVSELQIFLYPVCLVIILFARSGKCLRGCRQTVLVLVEWNFGRRESTLYEVVIVSDEGWTQ